MWNFGYFITDGLSDLLTKEDVDKFKSFEEGTDMLHRIAASPLRRDDATALCFRFEE